MSAIRGQVVRDGVHATAAELSPSDDAALLVGVRAGSEPDFEALFLRHYGKIHKLLQRLVGDEADDLAQEVFWRLYTRPPRETDTHLVGWLYRVATHLGYNALRARRRRDLSRERQASTVDSEDSIVADPETSHEQRAEIELVRATLARLGKRQATVLALRYSGLSYREIAQAMAVAPGSVGTLLARAERAFAALYRELETRER